MGVISKNDRKIGCYGSESNESLHIPPSGEEEDDAASGTSDNVQIAVPAVSFNRRRRRIWPVPSSFGNIRTKLGKRHRRRNDNLCQLETLIENEELEELTIQDFFSNTTGRFSSVFENEVWENFMASPEDQQFQLIQKEAQFYGKKQKGHFFLSREPSYQNISNGLRSKLRKCHIPLGMIEPLEKMVMEFFLSCPTGIYISENLSSFQRLLLHAVAQYHSLLAQSFSSKNENIRLVRISNSCLTFAKPTVTLVEYLEMKTRGRIQ